MSATYAGRWRRTSMAHSARCRQSRAGVAARVISCTRQTYAHERLTPEQWREAIDTLEKNLGLEDHQRVVVEHVKEGRQHYHVIWNRVDVDTMRVRDMGGNFYTHERTARQLEEKFGLERTPRARGEREGERVSKRTDLWEYDRGHESGQSPREIKAELTTLWQAAGNGRVFVEALERHGYILAKGDRRDFCVIDRAGDEHMHALTNLIDTLH